MSKQVAQSKRNSEPETVEAYVFQPGGGGFTAKRCRVVVVEELDSYGPDFLWVGTEWAANKITRAGE